MNQNEYNQEVNDQIIRRHEELKELINKNINPYPHVFNVDSKSAKIISDFKDDSPQMDVKVAGRIMSIRKMGKASFFHIHDSEGKIQIYIRRDDIGESYDNFKLLDIGDIVGVKGFVFRTKMGEVSIHAKEYLLLSKSLRPLPVAKEKIDEAGNKIVFDPFSDKELRYRQRYVDLIVNENVKKVFIDRTKIISSIREFLNSQNYLEVETPVLQPLYGGASARPFVTHHNTLDMKLFLRIADELYLKRLIVGGFEGVYEISKDFRNEGMDKNHNPEFTMMELYVAYKDYIWMMELVEKLINQVVKNIHGSATLELKKNKIEFPEKWKRITMFDALKEYSGFDLRGKSEDELRAVAKKLHIEINAEMGVGKIIDEIFSVTVQPHLIQPTFITDYPIELSPLAKKHRSEPGLTERFEGYINGQEICNAFTELNDPIDQRERFMEQLKLGARGDSEAQTLDEDFLKALEYGMPPTAGLGIGIDRLVMLVTGQDSIRDVLFFPQMKKEE